MGLKFITNNLIIKQGAIVTIATNDSAKLFSSASRNMKTSMILYIVNYL